jgi:hypothetical protein
MEHERNVWDKTFHRGIIHSKIGDALRAQYDSLSQPIPQRLLTLLIQLNEQRNTECGQHFEQNNHDR